MKKQQDPKSSAQTQLSLSFDSNKSAPSEQTSKIVSLKDFRRKAVIGYVLKNSKPF